MTPAPAHSRFAARGVLVVIAAIACLGPGASAASRPTPAAPLVLVADKDYPPLSWLEGDTAKGLDVDIARALETKLQRPVRVELKNWNDAQRDVLERRADGLLSMSITDERREHYTFTDSIHLHEFGLFVRSGELVPGPWPKRIGVTAGGYPLRFFADAPSVELVTIANYEEGFAQLADRRVDAIAADVWVASYTIHRRGLTGVTLARPLIATLPAAIAVRKDDDATADALNRAIRALQADGTVQAIAERWRPQEMVFLSRQRIHTIVYSAIGALLVLLLAGVWCWVVTLRRQVRVRTRAEECSRLLAHALHAANDCVAITDADDCVLYANEAFLRTYEYKEDEVIGRHVSMFRPAGPPVGDGPPEGSGWETWRGELQNQSRSGRIFPISLTASIVRDEHGKRIAAVGVARDVSREREADAALRASEARYRQLVENANDAVFTVDADGFCRSMNRAGEEMSGCEADGGAVHLSRLLVPDQIALAEAQLRRVLSGEAVPPFELTLAHPSGARVTVELALRAVPRTAPPALAQGIARDVTLRKQLELQVAQSQKMQAIGQLAAGVAHDFNNLMTVVLGNCDEAARLIGSDHPGHGLLHDVQQAAERAAALTGQLLAFSRRQMLQPRVLRLDDVVSETQRMLGRLIGEHIELRVERGADLGCVSLDPGQLQQILLNLTVNARDAMPQGGRLTIDTRNVRVGEEDARAGRDVPPGDYVMLRVQDTGTGMDAATRDRLFEPFFTTKPVGRGTGLGLSTVHGIVEQSDGFIRVHSEPGAGATFTIYFPRVHDRPGPVSVPAVGNRPGRSGDGEIVIVVEDERAVRDLVRRFLEGAGYTVLSAANATDAIAMCHTLTAAPALLVTDVVMPGMTGPDLAETLRRSWPTLQVLFLSGYTDEAILRNGRLPAGTHFQQKPFALDALVRKVSDILDRSDAEQAS